MKTLKEIEFEIKATRKQLHDEAKSIHPKLISTLSNEDLLDHTLCDDTLRVQFNLLQTKITKANARFYEEACEYFREIVMDLYHQGVTVGMHYDASPIDDFIDMYKFEPSAHTKALCTRVDSFSDALSLTPFWRRSIVLMNGGGVSCNVHPSDGPVTYIKYAQNSLINNVPSLAQKLIAAVKTQVTSGYEMQVPPIKPDLKDSTQIEIYVKSVINHKIMEAILNSGTHTAYVVPTINYTPDGISIELNKELK